MKDLGIIIEASCFTSSLSVEQIRTAHDLESTANFYCLPHSPC